MKVSFTRFVVTMSFSDVSRYLKVLLCIIFVVVICAILYENSGGKNYFLGEVSSNYGKYGGLSSLMRNATQIKDDMYELQKLLHKHIVKSSFRCNKKPRFGKKSDGGYEICLDGQFELKSNSCLVYSFGSRNEFSFEDAVYQRYGCEFHIFDPSIPGVEDYERKPKMYFHALGLAANDSDVVVDNRTWKMKSFGSIVRLLKHQERSIDAVKMDIEGYEWETLRTMVDKNELSNVKELLVEFHTNKLRNEKMQPEDYYYMIESLDKIERAGFLKFMIHHQNGCCGKFNAMALPKVTKSLTLCCYEIFYVNKKFLR